MTPAKARPTGGISPAALAYLRSPALAPVWEAARRRLERNEVRVTGAVHADLDEAGVDALAGLGLPAATPGRVRVRLDHLDAALRASAAAAGLVSVLEALAGPIVDQRAAARSTAAAAASTWAGFEVELDKHRIAAHGWATTWLEGIRRAGLLTRAGPAAPTLARRAAAVVADLAPAFTGEENPIIRHELAALASKYTGTAHGLDDGTLLANLVLRAVAAGTGTPAPTTAAERRDLWTRAGVDPDLVSGTLLVWALRPPGPGQWAQMMRARADLDLVTHVTLQEWTATASAEQWAAEGETVRVCENPQVLQAAAAAKVTSPLLCTSGNPATVASAALDKLLTIGADVRYHGDFDPAGIRIASRLFGRGVRPWRMSAEDYRAAVDEHVHLTLVPLDGPVPDTPWDPALATAMRGNGLGVHEELVVESLVGDLLDPVRRRHS